MNSNDPRIGQLQSAVATLTLDVHILEEKVATAEKVNDNQRQHIKNLRDRVKDLENA